MKGYKERHSVCAVKSERGGKSTRDGDKSGVGRRERIKRGRGTQDREERSKGIEIRITDVFTIIKPTTPFRNTKHEESETGPTPLTIH